MDRDELKALLRANRIQRLEAEEWQIHKAALQAAEANMPDDWEPGPERRSPEQIEADIDKIRPPQGPRPAHRPSKSQQHEGMLADFDAIRPHVKFDKDAYAILRDAYPEYAQADSIRRVISRTRKRTKVGLEQYL